MEFRLSFDASSVQDVDAALLRLRRFAQRPTVALKRIGFYQERAYQKAFSSNRDPSTGKPWAPLKPETRARKRNKKPLVETVGRIPASLFSEVVGNVLSVGYADPLAAIHHKGSETRPHKIIPKNRTALYWKVGSRRVFARSVNHPGSVIPSRPLIGYSPEDLKEWGEILVEEAQIAWSDE